MTVAVAAQRWTCGRCGVSVGQLDGSQVTLPHGWTSSDEGDFCLGCRRERAAEAALEALPEGSSDARAKARRAGLIEFEVKRTPDLADNMIARACRSTPAAVAAARERLGA